MTFCVSALRRGVSTHAPARGRLGATDAQMGNVSFNSRPREGATRTEEVGDEMEHVSTHAPARGRRLNLLVGHDVPPCFNSRPREGATRFATFQKFLDNGFNSRPREGATKGERYVLSLTDGFNSRPREGATSKI